MNLSPANRRQKKYTNRLLWMLSLKDIPPSYALLHYLRCQLWFHNDSVSEIPDCRYNGWGGLMMLSRHRNDRSAALAAIDSRYIRFLCMLVVKSSLFNRAEALRDVFFCCGELWRAIIAESEEIPALSSEGRNASKPLFFLELELEGIRLEFLVTNIPKLEYDKTELCI